MIHEGPEPCRVAVRGGRLPRMHMWSVKDTRTLAPLDLVVAALLPSMRPIQSTRLRPWTLWAPETLWVTFIRHNPLSPGGKKD